MRDVQNQKSNPHDETKILVDYLCFTIRWSEFLDSDRTGFVNLPPDAVSDIPTWVANQFYLGSVDFQERHGLNGYAYNLYYDGIVLAWGGNDTVYMQMSGTGCRTWETLHPGLTWENWISYLQKTYATLHFTRIDIACDTFGLLKLKTIQKFTRDGKFISRWKTHLNQEGSSEMSVIWGSSKSDFRLRIYDKTLEREVKGGVNPDELPQGWVRCEFQLRNDAAASFVRSWQENQSIGSSFLGIMRNQLLYVTEYDGKNRDRAVLARWWDKLLGDSQQIHMAYNAGKDYNFDSLKKYIFGQAGSSLKTYLAIMDGDLTQLLQNIAGCRMNDRQQELFASVNPERQKCLAEQLARQKEYLEMINGEGFSGGEVSKREAACEDRGMEEGKYTSEADCWLDWMQSSDDLSGIAARSVRIAQRSDAGDLRSLFSDYRAKPVREDVHRQGAPD